jgi:hypothetical protein
MAAEGATAEFAERVCNDTVELWSTLGLDMLVLPRPARREGMDIKALADNRWRFTDLLTGYWEDFIYTINPMLISGVCLDG